jgi:hypothetical protein
MIDAYCFFFSGSVAKFEGCCGDGVGPNGAEEDVEEGAMLRTHRRQSSEALE